MLSASWIMMSPSYESPPGHIQVQKASFDFSSDLTGPSFKLTHRKEKRRAEDEYPSQPAARSLQSLVSSSRSSLTLLATLNMLPVSLFWQSDLSILPDTLRAPLVSTSLAPSGTSVPMQERCPWKLQHTAKLQPLRPSLQLYWSDIFVVSLKSRQQHKNMRKEKRVYTEQHL